MSDTVKPADAALLREIAMHEYTGAYLLNFHGLGASSRLIALADALERITPEMISYLRALVACYGEHPKSARGRAAVDLLATLRGETP